MGEVQGMKVLVSEFIIIVDCCIMSLISAALSLKLFRLSDWQMHFCVFLVVSVFLLWIFMCGSFLSVHSSARYEDRKLSSSVNAPFSFFHHRWRNESRDKRRCLLPLHLHFLTDFSLSRRCGTKAEQEAGTRHYFQLGRLAAALEGNHFSSHLLSSSLLKTVWMQIESHCSQRRNYPRVAYILAARGSHNGGEVFVYFNPGAQSITIVYLCRAIK